MSRRKKKWAKIQKKAKSNVQEVPVEQPVVEEVVVEEPVVVEEVVTEAEEVTAEATEEANSVVENVEEMLKEVRPAKKTRGRKKKEENESV